ncbi:MAG: YcaO-like family protein, partial [Polaromonas sp.]|nr:YcaO-like family protein [Polaromonas sp.]
GDDRPHTWGRDTDPWLAFRKAAAEAIEREGFREPRQLVSGSFASLKNAVDPGQFVKYSDRQYADPGFPYQRFDAQAIHLWTAGTDLLTGRAVRVLAELVFPRSGLAAHGAMMARPFTQVTSSGCAASTSVEDATRRALLEVIERDAFMRHWLAQAGGSVVPSSRFKGDIRDRIRALEQTGCRIVVQKLDSPWAQVCLVAAQHATQHFTTMGTSAHADFSVALGGALDETEARVYAWIHGHKPEVGAPDEVGTTEHHFELYGLKRYFRRADRVLFPDTPATGARLATLKAGSTQQLVERFAAKGIHPVIVDITPERCFVDQGRTRLSVVKALVPGLLPISFGYQREPLGMVPRVHPGSKFPHPFP